MGAWRFEMRARPAMPPLAWVAAVRPGEVSVDHGTSVRTYDGGFFEGTWVGDQSPPYSSTVFGTGMDFTGGELIAVPPTHHLECLYLARVPSALVISNSLTGVLVATGLELDPRADYSRVFLHAVRAVWLIDDPIDGLRHQSFLIPTTTTSITGWFVENLRIKGDLSTAQDRRPREEPFASFADYKSRLTEATRWAFRHAVGYEPVVALSSGYDSAAVAAVAAAAGARRAVGFQTARPSAAAPDDSDSGEVTAAALGLQYEGFDRLAYLRRTDLAEADVFATGMAGEDIAFLGIEQELKRSVFLNGYWGGIEFAFANRDGWRHVSPITTSGADFTEFRLRADFCNVPLPLFGAIRGLDAPGLLDRAEMDPYRVGGRYDRPIPRRLAEDAGVKRGTFATHKRAANVLPPREGLAAFSVAARESIESFAASEGLRAEWRPRRPFSRVERRLVQLARAAHLAPFAAPLERRRTALTHFAPAFGNLVFRWSVNVVSERYAAVERVY